MIAWLLFCLLLTSCKAFERTTDVQKSSMFKETDQVIKRMDSIIKNGAIRDDFRIPLPKANTGDANKDAHLNRELLDLVKRLSTRKSSGNNSYKVGYSDSDNSLYIRAYMAATQDITSRQEKQDSVTTTATDSKATTSDTQVIVWPWWLYLFVGIGIFYIVFNLITTIKSMRK